MDSEQKQQSGPSQNDAGLQTDGVKIGTVTLAGCHAEFERYKSKKKGDQMSKIHPGPKTISRKISRIRILGMGPVPTRPDGGKTQRRCPYCCNVINSKGRLVHLQTCKMFPKTGDVHDREMKTGDNNIHNLMFVPFLPYAEMTWVRPLQPYSKCPICGFGIIWNTGCLQYHIDNYCQGHNTHVSGDSYALSCYVNLGKKCKMP